MREKTAFWSFSHFFVEKKTTLKKSNVTRTKNVAKKRLWTHTFWVTFYGRSLAYGKVGLYCRGNPWRHAPRLTSYNGALHLRPKGSLSLTHFSDYFIFSKFILTHSARYLNGNGFTVNLSL